MGEVEWEHRSLWLTQSMALSMVSNPALGLEGKVWYLMTAYRLKMSPEREEINICIALVCGIQKRANCNG